MPDTMRSDREPQSGETLYPADGPGPGINTSSLSQQAYHHIKQLILSGKLRCGEKISEKNLARDLNVSRTPVREALKLLEQYGLVEFKPRSYAKVSSITEREAKCLSLVRVEIEKLVARTLIAHNERLDADTLLGYVEHSLRHLESGNPAGAFLNDSAFHLEMARQSDNPILYEVLERLDSKSHLVRLLAMVVPEVYAGQLRDHLDIIDCLKNRDEERVLHLLELHIKPRFWESLELI